MTELKKEYLGKDLEKKQWHWEVYYAKKYAAKSVDQRKFEKFNKKMQQKNGLLERYKEN